MQRQGFDINNVTAAFLEGRYPERNALVHEISDALRAQALPVKHLVAEVGEHAMKQRANPIQTIMLGVMYGMVLGILMERDRLGQEARLQ